MEYQDTPPVFGRCQIKKAGLEEDSQSHQTTTSVSAA